MMEIVPPEEWLGVLDIFEKERGAAIIIGAIDTGKSTLAKFLIFNLCQRGLKVALVDADIGQSFLGPPTTIGLSLFKSDPDWKLLLSPPEIFFVGSITPEGYFPIHLEGVKRMVDKAVSMAADVILVDTTGFVLGDTGKELKRRKIDLISPRFIFALQKSAELEPILEHYKESPLLKIFRLPLSDQVRPRSMEERKTYRDDRFREYFKNSSILELVIEGVRIEGDVRDPNGESIPLDWALRISGLLAGLKDINDGTLGLAVLRNYIEEKKVLRVLTPLGETEKVRTVHLSSLKVIIPLYEEPGA
ncbi:MAG: Clp1/GlmU family protein [Thermodesulfobacteriota bacterium]